MAGGPPTTPRTLTRESIAAELGGAAIPEGYVCFKGYLDDGQDGTHKIVVDNQFLRWMQVNTCDIVGQLDIPDDPCKLIWVRRGARMTKCEIGYAPDMANAGWGVDFSVGRDLSDLSDLKAAMTDRRGPPPPY
jgi:hypothetical protein